ncbi:alcohol dehydrogenase catalytic domain-containing protein [Aeromicrobium sp. Root472D3]|uniref:zinc-binding dehydrogenase n=1 Tax=Aeromicrobium sp. Root472D3 TaxID=1736540 RepID=UPI0006F41C18|nr:alcohol dehydrogenase catalytic domain-containing protein [Aeromicrobium sp. Root472D3]KQX73867.1 alcohol dehydrogenase [Aeromicrobium sp. Root472D3]
MRAVMFDEFGQLPRVVEAPAPTCPPDGVVVRVASTGLCRSDWHGWRGHDAGISLPHVPGHELAGTIAEVGEQVTSWTVGDRVTTPFVIACGVCASCRRGDHQVCDDQRQPGFTGWGSFADLVAIERAEVNLVRIPSAMSFDVAASLGCRFATAYRAVVLVGRVTDQEWVVVHGCGGVGLAAVMVAASRGARVVAVDVSRASLELAASVGATTLLDPREIDVPSVVRELTGGGADVSIDAIGHEAVVTQSLASLRTRGRHVQIGLVAGAGAPLADLIGTVIGSELQVLGSHGMAAHDYPPMMDEIAAGRLRPDLLIREAIGLDDVPHRLAGLDELGSGAGGATVIRL